MKAPPGCGRAGLSTQGRAKCRGRFPDSSAPTVMERFGSAKGQTETPPGGVRNRAGRSMRLACCTEVGWADVLMDSTRLGFIPAEWGIGAAPLELYPFREHPLRWRCVNPPRYRDTAIRFQDDCGPAEHRRARVSAFRFYLTNERGHFLRVRDIECDEFEIKSVVADLLRHAQDFIVAVEVWERGKLIARIERPISN